MSRNVDDLHQELLSRVSDDYQKTEGFPTWDFLRAFAYGLKNLWDKAFDVERKLDVNNMEGTDLERFVFQRKGLSRKQATMATGEITIVSGEGTINEGDLFSTSQDIRFRATETKTVTVGDTVAIEAVVGGVIGDVAANTITQMPITILGISEITNEYPTADGFDAETDKALRERYFEALQEPATSGNVYHYKRWAKEVEGVGDAKVFGLWAGDNTVQVVIIDSDKQVPSEDTVARCQEYIDPEQAGSGEGEAPVGAYCTVTAAQGVPININATIEYTGDIDRIRNDFEESVVEYLKEIAFKSNFVSVAKIGDLLLNTEGVNDYASLTINGSTQRITIAEKSVAIIGEVVVDAIGEW